MAPNEDIGRLVKKLGGPHYVARCIGHTPKAVVMWRIDGSIPHKWRSAIWDLALLRQVKLTKKEIRFLKIGSAIDIPLTR